MSYGASLFRVGGSTPSGTCAVPEGRVIRDGSVRQCEREQRAAVRGAEHLGQEALGPAAPAARGDDVLLAVDAVRRGARVVAAAALERPQVVARLGVERVELAARLACEHEAAAGGEDRRAHREVPTPAPLLRAGARVEGADGARDVVGVHRDARAPVRDALDELPAAPRGRRPDVLHRAVEELRLRAVRRVRPLLRAGRPGPEVHRVAFLVGVAQRRHVALVVDLAPVDAVHERHDPDRVHVRAVEDVEEPVLVEVGGQLLPIEVEQDVLHRGVVVPQVVRRVLEMVLDLAGVGVNRDAGVGVEVVALANRSVEVRAGVARPVVQEVELRVVRRA